MENPDDLFLKILKDAAESIAENERESYRSDLEPFESFKQRKKSEIEASGSAFFDECTRAWEVILADLVGIGNTHPSGGAKAVVDELQMGMEKFAAFTKEKDWELKLADSDKTLMDVLGFSQELLEQFYQVGLRSFKGAHFEDAERVFTLISLLNPLEHNAWLSLGITKENCSKWEEAVHAFKVAERLQGSDPVSLVHQGQCYHAMRDKPQALSLYEQAIKEAGNQPEYAEIKQRAIELKIQLEFVQ